MRETSIGFKASEVLSAYHSEDYNAIFRYVSSAADELKTNYRIKDYTALQDNYDMLKKSFLFLRKEEETNESIGYLVGYISGVLRAVEEFTFSAEFKLERLMREKKDLAIDDIPHIKEILRVLSRTSELRHGVLADRIKIDKSTLTPIMDRLCKSGLVSFSRMGNRKYYYLTALGKSYLEQNIHTEEKISFNLTSYQAWLFVQQALEQSSHRINDCLKQINKKLEQTINSESSYLTVPDLLNDSYAIPPDLHKKAVHKYNSDYQNEKRNNMLYLNRVPA